MGRRWDFTTSYTASVLRGGLGRFLVPLGPRPEKLLEVYEFEACPFCRRVREALTILDLDAKIFPCPKGGTRFRTVVKERGGRCSSRGSWIRTPAWRCTSRRISW